MKIFVTFEFVLFPSLFDIYFRIIFYFRIIARNNKKISFEIYIQSSQIEIKILSCVMYTKNIDDKHIHKRTWYEKNMV